MYLYAYKHIYMPADTRIHIEGCVYLSVAHMHVDHNTYYIYIGVYMTRHMNAYTHNSHTQIYSCAGTGLYIYIYTHMHDCM